MKKSKNRIRGVSVFMQ